MSNTLHQKSLNMWRSATLVTPTLSGTVTCASGSVIASPTISNPTFTGTITLPAGNALKNQSLTGFVSSIVSATAIVATIPVKLVGTLTSLSVSCNVATTTGPATFTFYRVQADGTTTAITDGVISIAITDTANVAEAVTVSQVFLATDSLKVIVGGTNDQAGNAHFAGLFTVA